MRKPIMAALLLLLATGMIQAEELHAKHENRGYLGISVMTTERIDGENTDVDVQVAGVMPGGAAEQAGLRDHDRIVALDGIEIRELADIHRALEQSSPGDSVAVTYARGEEQETVNVVLGSRQPVRRMAHKRFGVVVEHDGPFLGIHIQPLNSQLAGYFGVERGLLITEVMENTAAAEAGLEAGDVVLEIGNHSITDRNTLREALDGFEIGQQVPLRIQRRGAPMTQYVELREMESQKLDLLHIHGDHEFGEHSSAVIELVEPDRPQGNRER